MEIESLLDYLEIESAEEFQYFEHLADLIECDEQISYEAFYYALSRVPCDALFEITEHYFDDIQSALPDDSTDFFTLLDTIKQALLGLSQNSDDEKSRILYVEELYRFRNWYHFDSLVSCTSYEDNTNRQVPISEALSLSRLERLNEGEYRYDFSQCMDYDINEYAFSFAASIDMNYDGSLEEERDDFEEGLIDRENPVIDGEYYEED